MRVDEHIAGLDKLSLEEKIGLIGDSKEITSADNDAEALAEASFNQQEVYNLARNSLDFLAALAAPLMVKFHYPPVFIAVWNWLISYADKPRDFSKLALGLPRGFGKTTVVKLFILYCILFTRKQFILIISANAKAAANIIADVCDMLDESNVVRVFGSWRVGLEKDTQELKKFGFRGRNIILAAVGQGGSGIRGLNLKFERPDIIIFEDVQTREDADSASISQAIEQWMYGTAMKAKSPSGCLYIFVANMYPTRYSILRKLKANPSWTKFIAGGILADGTSLWEELQPIAQLLEEFEADLNSGHPEIFYAEVLNDENASLNTKIDISAIPDYPYQDADIHGGNFIIIDPSSDKSESDLVSIGYFEVHEARPVLRRVLEGRYSPGDTIKLALNLALTNNCTLIVIESNAYQYSLSYWFQFICVQLGIQGIDCVPMYSGMINKIFRILSMFKELTKGELYYHPECRSQVTFQITQFNPLKRNNVDGILDLLTYAIRVISEYGHLINSRTILALQEYNQIELPGELETSTF